MTTWMLAAACALVLAVLWLLGRWSIWSPKRNDPNDPDPGGRDRPIDGAGTDKGNKPVTDPVGLLGR